MHIMLLVLASVLASATFPASPLDGCTAAPSDGGWLFKCDGLAVTLQDWTRGSSGEHGGALTTVMDRLATAYGNATRTRERWRLAGADTEVQRLEIADQNAVAYVTAIPRREGTRALLCFAKGDAKRCVPVMELLAARPWRAGPVPGTKVEEAARLTLAGLTVSVPAGCRGETRPNGGGYVSCAPGTFASWGVASDEAMARTFLDIFDKKTVDLYRGSNARIVRGFVPCRLGGVETTCQRTLVEPGTTSSVTVLSGFAPAGGKIVIANCIAPGGTGAAMPCALVLQPR